jgi:hypothetical protein
VQTDEGAILFLDPGGTTGMALWRFRDQQFQAAQGDFRTVGRQIEQLAETARPLSIGFESYAVTPGRQIKHDGSAFMVIGMTRWLAFRHQAIMLPSQPPSARRLGLRHLKTVGWYRAGIPHGMDAAAHLLVVALKDGWLPEEMKEAIRVSSGN